jgi:hypothetical protein
MVRQTSPCRQSLNTGGGWVKMPSMLTLGATRDAGGMAEPLPELSTAELETLHAALDPLLDGFGEGDSCLDDASAFLARLGLAAEATPVPLIQWLDRWRAVGGNRLTLRLMVTTLLAERRRGGAALS